MATQFHRTVSSAGSDYKATFSAWVKRATPGVENFLLYAYYNSSNNHRLNFLNSDELHINIITSASNSATITTNRKFRDPNAWYHIVVAWDSTQSTASDRIKIYVNGVQETSFSTSNYPSQNADMFFNKNTNGLYLGGQDGSNHFQGVMSHVHYVDGTAYSASTFGSTDSTTGEWKINTSPSVTYGTNGWLVFEDGNTYTDQSSNSNNLTLTGTAPTKTEDNPSNVFATLNPLLGPRYSTQTFSNGNTTVAGGSGHEMHMSTLAIPNSGKYYYEAKLDAIGNYPIIGVVEAKNVITNNKDINTYGYGYFFNGNIVKLGGSPISPTYSSYTTGDFIGVAVDCDNKEIYFSKNGTWQNSSDPANRTNPAITGLLTEDLMLGVNNYGGTWSVNFGNGAFGSTQLTGTTYQGNGNYGIFKYPVPTGFRALCTKTLNL
tara:strand:+ start:216 stop:1514 length:1299 start_codon:yes stop_codon:yes gene_type:complete